MFFSSSIAHLHHWWPFWHLEHDYIFRIFFCYDLYNVYLAFRWGHYQNWVCFEWFIKIFNQPMQWGYTISNTLFPPCCEKHKCDSTMEMLLLSIRASHLPRLGKKCPKTYNMTLDVKILCFCPNVVSLQ